MSESQPRPSQEDLNGPSQEGPNAAEDSELVALLDDIPSPVKPLGPVEDVSLSPEAKDKL